MSNHLPGKIAVAVSAAGFAAVLTAASAITFHAFRAEVSDGLIGIQINADGPLSVEAGGSIRLTAEGDYGTMTMPVRARWSARGDADVTLTGCKRAKQCTVTAGEKPGVAEIEAEAEGYRAQATIEITEVFRNPFADDVPSWALPSILRMHKLGVIKGYDDGRFGAGDPMTHGQVVTLLARILQHANLTDNPQDCSQVYEDVPQTHYAFEPACLFEQQGWADAAPRLEADAAAPRAAVARFVHRVFGKTIPTTLSSEQIFDDVPTSHSSFADTAFTHATGIMTGNPSGDFGVQEPVNRAAGAVVMARVLDLLESRDVKALEGYRPAAPQQSSAPSSASSSPPSTAGTVSCDEIAGKSFTQASNGDVTAYVSNYGLYVCVGNEQMARVVHDTYSGVNFPSIAGRKVVYFKEYGINVYDVDTQAVTEAEPKHSGANMPTSAGDYAAYFKDYGIVVYHLSTGKKTQVEPASSGCNDPKLDGMTLRYQCNYKSKTFDLRLLEESSPTSSSSTPSSVSAPPSIPPPAGSIDAGVMELRNSEAGSFWSFWGVEDGTWKKFQYRNSGDIEIQRVYTTTVTITKALQLSEVKMVMYEGTLPFREVGADTCRKTIDANTFGGSPTVYLMKDMTLCIETDDGFVVKTGNFTDVSTGQEDKVNLSYVLWKQPAQQAPASSATSATSSTASSITATTSVHITLPASAPAGEHYGFLTVAGRSFYDISSDALKQEDNALPPYDILIEQNRSGGWLGLSVPSDARTAMAEIRSPSGTVGTTVTATTYADCTRALQEGKTTTSVTLAQEDGQAVCLLTSDGYVMVLENAGAAGSQVDIRYRVWAPGSTPSVSGERTGTLEPANFLLYDFSEGRDLPTTDKTYDLWIMRDYNGGKSTMTLQQNTQNLITMYPSSRNFETTSKELCEHVLTFAPQQWSGNKLMLSGKSDAVCFQTNDGFIGKIGNMSHAAFAVQYALWEAPVWEFLPEYQPGESLY